MPSQALTPEFLETLPSLTPEARGTYYFDTEITGFAVEHRANGRATYYYRYRDAGKRVRLARIGAVDEISLIEARVLASRMKKMVAEGGDPKLEADRFKDIPTFAEFAAEHYMPHVKTRKRSWISDDSLLRNHILPVLGKHRLSRIRRSDIIALHNGLKQSGYAAATANRALVLISFMFNCAMRWEVMPMAPELVSKLGPSDRKRLLTLSDVAARAERGGLVHLVQRRVATDVFAYLAIARPRPRHKARAMSALLEAGEGAL